MDADPSELKPRCARCVYWSPRVWDRERGELEGRCFGNPPRVYWTLATDACDRFREATDRPLPSE